MDFYLIKDNVMLISNAKRWNDLCELQIMTMNNLANHPEMSTVLNSMKENLRGKLEYLGQPFGEFNEGTNTSTTGLVDEEINKAKLMKINHKTVVLPDELGGGVWGELPSETKSKNWVTF